MSVTGLIRQLKKQWRKNRVKLSLGIWLFAVGIIAITAWGWLSDDQTELGPEAMPVWQPDEAAQAEESEQSKILAKVMKTKDQIQVVLLRKYICGEETSMLGSYQASEIPGLWSAHPAWKASYRSDVPVLVFTEQVEDLSPTCKNHVFMGIDRNGNLSMFNGAPEQEQVIRTFFQLNIEYLESSLPEETVRQLRKGIRISDYAEYNSVLATFSDFAVEQSLH